MTGCSRSALEDQKHRQPNFWRTASSTPSVAFAVLLTRREVTLHVVVPIASALVAHRDRYFDLLDRYREGAASPIIADHPRSARRHASQRSSRARRPIG
jgi:hypothetical protein